MVSLTRGRTRLAWTAAAALLAAGCGDWAWNEQARQALKQRLEAAPPAELGQRRAELWKSARRFYEKNGYRPVWLDGAEPNKRARSLQSAVADVATHGLDPAQYDLGWRQPLQVRSKKAWNPIGKGEVPPAQIAEAEIRLTSSFLKLASELLIGRVDPALVNAHWFGQYRLVAPERMLERALETGRVHATLNGLVPHHPQYEALRGAMQRYRDVASKGGWPTGFAPGTLSPAKAAALRQRLQAEGDLPAPAGKALAPRAGLDPALRAGLRRFEERHRLPPHRLLGARVVMELNGPVEARIRRLALNLERWRWLPETLGDKHILVNIPSYWLIGVEDGRTTIQMRVVTGTEENPTPIFSDRMTTVVFSPYWNVPASIAREEIQPALLRDPSYLERNDMEVVRGSEVVSPWSVNWDAGGFTVRQRPGPKNALGKVKFIFPNDFDVYLHDTPADSLFANTARNFSHGCVRVEQPFELAQWVLRGQEGWTPDRIQEAMASGRERHVAVKNAVPVYIVYATAWVEPDGRVSFREDVYGHDSKQLKLLPPPSPPPPLVAANDTSAGSRGR